MTKPNEVRSGAKEPIAPLRAMGERVTTLAWCLFRPALNGVPYHPLEVLVKSQ